MEGREGGRLETVILVPGLVGSILGFAVSGLGTLGVTLVAEADGASVARGLAGALIFGVWVFGLDGARLCSCSCLGAGAGVAGAASGMSMSSSSSESLTYSADLILLLPSSLPEVFPAAFLVTRPVSVLLVVLDLVAFLITSLSEVLAFCEVAVAFGVNAAPLGAARSVSLSLPESSAPLTLIFGAAGFGGGAVRRLSRDRHFPLPRSAFGRSFCQIGSVLEIRMRSNAEMEFSMADFRSSSLPYLKPQTSRSL